MTPLPQRSPGWQTAAVACLLLAHYAIALTATLDASATFDEVLHIASGLSYWKFDDYRLQPENGNLPQRWCALPLLVMGYSFPENEAAWRRSDSFGLGRELLYESGNDPAVILGAARAMAAVWSTALCLVVYLWSRSLFGEAGGLVSLGLAAFWPALVAHGPLATSDACGTLFFTLGAWSLWTLVNRVTVGSIAAASIAVGLAAIAKHSCVLLAPLAAIFVIIQAASRRPLPLAVAEISTTFADRGRKVAVMAASLAGPLLAAVFAIWFSCGFRYRAFEPGSTPAGFFWFPTLAECVGHAGGVGAVCERVAAWRLLPESWLWGLSYVAARSGHREAFAIGDHSMFGWWWFFPLCLAIKNTLPSLALAGFGVARAVALVIERIARRLTLDGEAWNVLPLLVWLGLLWPTFLTSHLNIGERHLIPAYPPLMILAGGCWRAATVPWRRLLICGLVVLHAADVVSRYPASLAYFNQLVPRGEAHQWLVDSSLDWGQDLRRLGRWLEQHTTSADRIYVNYSGAAPVSSELGAVEHLGYPRGWGVKQVLEPGVYCVSATALEGVSDRPRGRWCRLFEDHYRRASQWLDAGGKEADADAAKQLLRACTADRDDLGVGDIGQPPSLPDLAMAAFNILQAARLEAFLRQRKPDASIGGSILVYRLDAAAIEEVIHGPPAELDDLCWFEREGYGTPDELLRQGRQHLAAGRAAAARAVFASATRFYSGDPRLWDGLSAACQLLGDDTAATAAEHRRDRLRARLEAAEATR
jgi:hypothetical protein